MDRFGSQKAVRSDVTEPRMSWLMCGLGAIFGAACVHMHGWRRVKAVIVLCATPCRDPKADVEDESERGGQMKEDKGHAGSIRYKNAANSSAFSLPAAFVVPQGNS